MTAGVKWCCNMHLSMMPVRTSWQPAAGPVVFLEREATVIKCWAAYGGAASITALVGAGILLLV